MTCRRPSGSAATGSSGCWGRAASVCVYLALDDQLNRPVAIKVPHARLMPRPDEAAAYLAEARTVASLDHPNIVPVYDVGSSRAVSLLHRLEVHRRRRPGHAAQAVAALAVGGRGTGGDGGRGLALRPQARAGPSRHQARQHAAGQERQALRGRFRAGPARTGLRQGALLLRARRPT